MGKNNHKFRMFKFRTFIVNAPELPKSEFVNSELFYTRIGKFLRYSSIDEIPQIFSVIKGDMSLVGPRPCLDSELKLIELRNKYGLNKLLPGITGFAQINGRDSVSLKHKVKYEKFYLDNHNLLLYFKILIITAYKVILFSNISH